MVRRDEKRMIFYFDLANEQASDITFTRAIYANTSEELGMIHTPIANNKWQRR
jgi:hypothetical protein